MRMDIAEQIDWLDISGKPVAVMDSHHHALVPWSRWWATARPLRLITLDHHCDTQESFLGAAFDGKSKVAKSKQDALRSALDPSAEHSVEKAVLQLRHDEHIDAAIRAGIIDAAFIIHEQNERAVKSLEQKAYEAEASALEPSERFLFRKHTKRPDPPMNYEMPGDRMVAIDPTYYCRDGSLVTPWPDRAVESDHLEDRLAIFEQVLRSAGEPALEGSPFVLDIDMDAFRTLKSLRPDDPSTFHHLVQGAVGVTVARERACCQQLWLDTAPLDTSRTEQLLLEQHQAAIG